MSIAHGPQLWTGLGAATSIFLTAWGASMASAQAGAYAVRNHYAGWKAFVPITQAGVLAIYGVIIAYLLVGKMDSSEITETGGYRNFSAGLSVGLACLSSGLGMARFLSTPEHEFESKNKNFFRTHTMVLIYLESIGLYGLIAALFLVGK